VVVGEAFARRDCCPEIIQDMTMKRKSRSWLQMD
jgi:hypothetical protein